MYHAEEQWVHAQKQICKLLQKRKIKSLIEKEGKISIFAKKNESEPF